MTVRRSAVVAAALAAGVLDGCNNGRPLREFVMPDRDPELPDVGRMDPAARLTQFEADFRVEPYNYDAGSTRSLVYPRMSDLQAAWTYVLLGRDFAAQRKLGSASRAYWAALHLAPRAMASRATRERIRRAAFTGLGEVAQGKGRPRWSRLYRLCAELCDEWLKTPDAVDSETRFQETLARFQDEKRRQDKAATWAAISQGFDAGLANVQAQVEAQQSPGSFEPAQRAFEQGQALGEKQAEVAQAEMKAQAVLAASAGAFREGLASEDLDLQPDELPVGTEAMFQLTSAAHPQGVFDALLKFAREQASRELEAALLAWAKAAGAAANQEAAVKVGLAVRRLEAQAARAEWVASK